MDGVSATGYIGLNWKLEREETVLFALDGGEGLTNTAEEVTMTGWGAPPSSA